MKNIQAIKKVYPAFNIQSKSIEFKSDKKNENFIGKKFEEPSYDEKNFFFKVSNTSKLTEKAKTTNIINEESGEFLVR